VGDVHEVLDGHKSAASLDAAERTRLALLEQAIAEAVGPILADPAPDLADTVMRRVDAARSPASVGGAHRSWRLRSLWEPRTITLRIRPLAAAAVLALLVPAALAVGRRASPPVSDAPLAVAADSRLYVRFELDDSEASSVALAGSFTNWTPRYELHQTTPGVWSVLVPITPGVHQYAFIVDGGRWVPDPRAPRVDDGFGGSNSQLAVLPPSASL
jgi:hypothetical protein